MLGHVRYGTFGKNSIESVHPFLRQNNWMHRNLIVAGNFNMTNVGKLFSNLVQLGQHPKENSDTITVMENIGHFLDDSDRYMEVDVYIIDILLVTFEVLVINTYTRYIL